MTLSDKKKVISQTSLFSNLPDEELDKVANLCYELKFAVGQVITEQEDNTKSAYIICQGLVKVYRISEDGLEINLGLLGKGEIVGELSLLDSLPRSATVEVLQETTALKLNQNDLMKMLVDHPLVAVNLLKNLSSRLRITDQTLESVMSQNLSVRTWHLLQTLAPFFSNEIELSHDQLANMLGATRARVTEALNELQKSGKITLSHRKIKLL